MKFISLINPHKMKRRKSSRRKISVSRKRRTVRARRARRTKTRTVVKTRFRTRTKKIIRYRNRKVKAIRRRRGRGVRRVSRRRNRRALARFGGGGGFSIRGIFNKGNITTVAGLVASSVLTAFIINKYGDKLPGIRNATTGAVNRSALLAYSAAIPLFGAVIVGKTVRNPNLKQGLIYGGIAVLINALFSKVQESLQPVAAVNEYLSPQIPSNPPGYSAISTFRALPDAGNGNNVFNSESAFSNPWN